jgi:hypothetical protein
MGCAKFLAAIPGFFLSSWFLQLLWNGNIHKLFSEDAVKDLTYAGAMGITATIWLVAAPFVAVNSSVNRQTFVFRRQPPIRNTIEY